jgi:hypothetical protein
VLGVSTGKLFLTLGSVSSRVMRGAARARDFPFLFLIVFLSTLRTENMRRRTRRAQSAERTDSAVLMFWPARFGFYWVRVSFFFSSDSFLILELGVWSLEFGVGFRLDERAPWALAGKSWPRPEPLSPWAGR